MNLGLATYEHLGELRERKIDQLLDKATVVEPHFTISKVISLMTEMDSYDVFSIKNGDISSTNARDLLNARNISSMNVSSLLKPSRHLSAGDSVEKAATIMAHYRVRSVPVTSNDQILGVINAKNIVSLLSQNNLKWIAASSILTQNPITVSSKEPLAKARSIIISKRIDHIPVIHNNKVSQVLTSMHLLQVLIPPQRIGSDQKGLNPIKKLESPIGNLGSTRVPQCMTSDSISTVVDMMLKNDTSCCLLTLWNNLHGIITYRDLLNLLQTKIPNEVPLYIVGMPDDLRNADIVKTKFEKIIRNLTKVYPEVEEARASIKIIHSPLGQRQNYQVSVGIFTPYKTYNYGEAGWDLSQVFDALGRRIIRNLSKRRKRRWKTSIRKIEDSSKLLLLGPGL